ncbi:MAG TPA: cyclic nucleotide-binding domain-containing protein [Gaiellaceae bacterium]|nr:cyclic nucleotide-binding domain-containing protein [Gaiellaceae bacterium]
MRIQSSVTAISWIPSEAVEGLPKLPFTMGVAHYDSPPPDRIDNLETMHRADLFREANELRAWIHVEDGKITDHGQGGRGRIGLTRLKLGPKEIAVPAVAMPTLQNTEVGDGWVRFTQTAGGRTGMPAPRSVRGKPYFQINSAIAWTTLALTIHADGTSEHELAGASPFPRHWIYDKEGALVQKSGAIDFDKWYREAHEQNTPWGNEDSPAVVTAVESALERDLSLEIMGRDGKARPRSLSPGDVLVEQGDASEDSPLVYLVLDGVLEVVVDGDVVGELGPGAIVGERAQLEDGTRTATLRAKIAGKVVGIPAEELSREALEQVAAGHRREEG